jgi:hypothetical protein
VRPSHRFACSWISKPPELQIGTENAHRDANLARPYSSRRFQSPCRPCGINHPRSCRPHN